MRSFESSFDRRYIAILCLAALGVLVAGVVFRPKKIPPPVRSEPETLRTQSLRQRLDLDRRSLFYSSKAEELVTRAAEVRANPGRFELRKPAPGASVLLVATGHDGQTVWAPGWTAGIASVRCGEQSLDEVTTTITIPATLVNGVAFDFDDTVAGLVVPCGERLVLTTSTGFEAWNAERALKQDLLDCCGLGVAPDLTVITLTGESALAKTGVRAGDRIVSLNAAAVSTPSQLRDVLKAGEALSGVEVVRAGRTRKLRVRP